MYLWFGNVLVPLVAAVLHDESFVLLTQLVAKRWRFTLFGITVPCRSLIATHGDLTVVYGLVFGCHPVERSLLVLMVLPQGHLPLLLLFSLLLGFGHFHRLVVPACELILRLVLILDGLVDAGVAGGSLNIDGMQTAHVGLVHGDSILKGVAFWTLEDIVILDLGVVEPACEVLPPAVHEVILPRWHLGGEVLGLPVEPGTVRHEVLLVEGARLVESQLVVVHSINLLPHPHPDCHNPIILLDGHPAQRLQLLQSQSLLPARIRARRSSQEPPSASTAGGASAGRGILRADE